MCIKRKRVSVPTFDGKIAVFVYYVVADDWLFLQLWNRFVLKIHDLTVCDLLNLCMHHLEQFPLLSRSVNSV